MGTLFLWLLLLSSLLGALCQEDLEGKAFVFPSASNSAYVRLKLDLQNSLESFTLCERFQTDLIRPFALFSYATESEDNEFLLHCDRPNIFSIFMKQGVITFDVSKKPVSSTGKEHICFSWESETGLATLWWNGKLLSRKSIMKDLVVHGNASIILGQEQDSFGGQFDVNQSFVGEIEDVYFWGRVLEPEEICRVWNNRVVSRPLINWRELHYESHGEVILARSSTCACRSECVWSPMHVMKN
ncbi:mucosal pentraxin-like [Python bivittatus]|uniref:Pentraxin family member n=1 Tax=Python bivittatus TaxID=176946 RepID=A0A9F5IN31_PYTBI|nr:mucosal pentraxin-like [Python bivittatus]